MRPYRQYYTWKGLAKAIAGCLYTFIDKTATAAKKKRQIIRKIKDQSVALYPLMPNKMTVDGDESGQLYYQYMRYADEVGGNNETVILKPSDLLHITGLGFDGLVGYSPIEMAKNAIALASATEE